MLEACIMLIEKDMHKRTREGETLSLKGKTVGKEEGKK